MESIIFTYRQSRFSIRKYGNGAKCLIGFHGYGEDGTAFQFLEFHLGTEFTLVAIDLPFHGNTQWNDDLDFDMADLWKIINELLPINNTTVSFMGYSMGGRIALKLMEQNIAKVDKVVLLAPDGLHRNPWHWLATQTLVGNRLFAFTMKYPTWLFGLMNVANKLGVLNKSIFNFAHYYLDDDIERKYLYQRWTVMRKFHPNLHLLQQKIKAHQKKITLLFGRYDRIILTDKGKKFQQGLEEWVTVKELNAGHQLLKEKYVIEITATFRS